MGKTGSLLAGLLLASAAWAQDPSAPPLLPADAVVPEDAPPGAPGVAPSPPKLVDRVVARPVTPAARFGLGVALGSLGIVVGAPLFGIGGGILGLLEGSYEGMIFGAVLGALLGAGSGAGFGVSMAQQILSGVPVERDDAVIGGCAGSLIGAAVSAIWLLVIPWPTPGVAPPDLAVRLSPIVIGALVGALVGLDVMLDRGAPMPAVGPTPDGKGVALGFAGRF